MPLAKRGLLTRAVGSEASTHQSKTSAKGYLGLVALAPGTHRVSGLFRPGGASGPQPRLPKHSCKLSRHTNVCLKLLENRDAWLGSGKQPRQNSRP